MILFSGTLTLIDNGPVFISNRFSPGGTYPFFFSNRLRNFAFFFVPDLYPGKNCDLQGFMGSRPISCLFTSCYPAKIWRTERHLMILVVSAVL